MKFRFLIALLAIFALVAAACGGDDDDSSSASEPAAEAGDGAEEPAGDDGSEEEPMDDDAEEMMDDESHSLDIDAILAAPADASCADDLTGDPIRVGMAMDFSDVVGFVDIPGSNLVPYVAEKANCAGGINGSPVEVRVAEVGDDAALATQELLDWGAHFLIGPPFADFGQPVLQVTEGSMPVFFAASTEPSLPDIGANSFLVTFD
ncbi:MAG: hypothetical protein AAF480_19235, partial [Actinomycetota bacterium]